MVDNRQPEALAIVCVFTVVSFLFVAARIWSRCIGRNFAWDDYLIIISMILLVGDTIGTWVYILLSGTGFHVYDLPKRTVHEQLVALHWNFSVQMVYHPLMFTIRASIIMFLFRMKDKRRRIRWSLHLVFWLNVMYCIGTSLVNMFQCTPIRYVWSKPEMDKLDADGNIIPGGKCIDARTFILTSCALSIFMDLIIIPIPSIMVWGLQMSRRTKVLVVGVMSLGWIATGVSVGRFIVYYYRFAPDMKDRTWNIGIAISIAEPAVHIMTACAPATKLLFRYLFPYWGTHQSAGYYEDRTSTPQAWPSKTTGNRARLSGFSKFQFSFNERPDPPMIDPDEIAQSSHADSKNQSEFDMRPLESVDSRDLTEEIGGAPRTAPLEPIPKHCLGQAR
ncbi:hypothetical protein NX059_011571 [Plenodomus lindquistii]|nr:hypothetical protein NX059_011571 [Plenodomus lindquistii]